jgi:hypothetical protein
MQRKLNFIKANAAPPPAPSYLANFIETCRKVRGLSVCMAGVTVGAAALYWVGSFHGWGIRPTFGAADPRYESAIDFLDCLYFSLITITTLGYGDYRPESYGRLVAGLEALAGVIILGIFVSKLVSGQLDRRSTRLARGQLNAEIQEFRGALSNILLDFPAPAPLLVNQHSIWLYRSRGLVDAIARYWRHEARDPDLEETIPLRAANRLLGDLIDLLLRIERETSSRGMNEIHKEDRKAIRKISEGTLVLATVLFERSADDGLHHAYERTCDIVGRLRSQLALHEG